MSAVRADLSIQLDVTCPKCKHEFDMLIDTNLNEEGDLLSQAISDDRWMIDSDERLECKPICPECHIKFQVKGVNW